MDEIDLRELEEILEKSAAKYAKRDKRRGIIYWVLITMLILVIIANILITLFVYLS